jgi:hypothetical protein
MILPLVPYGQEICPLTLSYEHRLRVFGNKLLRRIFGPEMRFKAVGGNSTMRSFITFTLVSDVIFFARFN